MDYSTVRARLRDDLRQLFRGELLLDIATRVVYSTDASLFQVEPLAVASPRDEDDLATLVRYAFERSISLVPRGAGTGLAGESLGQGIIVDLSVHFRSVLDHGDDWVRVQPGVVLDHLNAALRGRGRRFAPEPESAGSCTIGGMIGTNASGYNSTLHGSTRDHLLGLRVLWDDGSADILGQNCDKQTASDRLKAIRNSLDDLLRTHSELISSHHARSHQKHIPYSLGQANDLSRFLVGTEGTLALTTEATLRTIPLPGGKAAILFGFPSFEAALQAGLAVRELNPAKCLVLDRRLLSLARTQIKNIVALPANTEAALFIEFERTSQDEADEMILALMSPLHEVQRTASLAAPMFGSTPDQEAWPFRGLNVSNLYAIRNGRRPLAFVEDVAVTPELLSEFVRRASGILKEFDVAASSVIDVPAGQAQLRPFLDPNDSEDAGRLWPLAERLHALALDMGGTVSARHGTGIARSPWVARQLGPLFPVLQEVKRVFDPRGILNPGKIVEIDPSRPAWPLRSSVRNSGLPTEGAQKEKGGRSITPLHVWASGEMAGAIAACNGCGACRSEEPAQRMCPTFRATHSELAAPRAKANLFHSLIENGLSNVDENDLRAVADLCVNCKMCAVECPGRADIPKLMLEAKAADHVAHGWRRSTWILARIDGLASFASKFALTSNMLLRRPTVRWALEKLFGLSRRRTLPAFTFRTFLGRARLRGQMRRPSQPGVAYFVDTYANLFDPSVAEATVAVLRHNGIPVYVPPRQRGCGAMALAHGDVEVARERLTHNVRRLADCVRNGDTVVCSEPTAALFFRLDSLGLLNDPDVALVAENTVELTAYLWTLHQQGKLRTDFRALNMRLGHHVPCHIKALGQGVHGPDLLALIPGLEVNKIDISCSGMAGTYGLNAKNFPVSMAIGRPMIQELSKPSHTHGSSECSACRLQMQEGSRKRALHPVQYMALAYGLMPHLADRLRRPFGGRVSS